MKSLLKIYLDFDGTIVEHSFPDIGHPNPHAIRVVNLLSQYGHDIWLNTYRIDIDKAYVDKAFDYLNNDDNKLLTPLPIDKFTNKKIYPVPLDWSEVQRTKILFLDDIADNTPLIKANHNNTMMVDWMEIERQLVKYNFL